MAENITRKPEVQFADPDYVREYLAEVPKVTWLECRENSHDWRPFRVSESEQSTQTRRVVTRTRKCRRCTTKRHDVIEVADGRAAILNSSYEWPEGYLMEKGHGRLSTEGRDIIRNETLFNEMSRLAGKR